MMDASTLAAHISDETSRFGENSGNGGPPNQGSWGTQDASRRRPDFLTDDIEPTPPTVAVPVQNVRIVPKIKGLITTIFITPRSPIEMENYFCQHTYCKWIRVNAEIVKGKGEKSIEVKIQRLSASVEVPERNDVCYWEVVELLDLNVV
ncbi:unnamed protein product [Caenorhabditis nigoni]